MMRPVMSGKVSSLVEVRDKWSLKMLYDFCEYLDYLDDLEYEAIPKNDN